MGITGKEYLGAVSRVELLSVQELQVTAAALENSGMRFDPVLPPGPEDILRGVSGFSGCHWGSLAGCSCPQVGVRGGSAHGASWQPGAEQA